MLNNKEKIFIIKSVNFASELHRLSNDLIPLRDYVCECAAAIRLHTRLLKTFS